jgi:hypothetical protein
MQQIKTYNYCKLTDINKSSLITKKFYLLFSRTGKRFKAFFHPISVKIQFNQALNYQNYYHYIKGIYIPPIFKYFGNIKFSNFTFRILIAMFEVARKYQRHRHFCHGRE